MYKSRRVLFHVFDDLMAPPSVSEPGAFVSNGFKVFNNGIVFDADLLRRQGYVDATYKRPDGKEVTITLRLSDENSKMPESSGVQRCGIPAPI